MHPSSVLLALGFLPAIALAAPNSPPVERASCTTIYPEFARVSEAQPQQSYLPGFIISQDSGATNKNDMFIEFTVPENANTCQLEVYFPPNYRIYRYGRQDVYVYSIDENLSRTDRGIDVSWANSPDPVSQVGTVKFESDPNSPTKKVINSFACEPKLTYRLSIGRDWTDPGYVSFYQNSDAGLRMTYC